LENNCQFGKIHRGQKKVNTENEKFNALYGSIQKKRYPVQVDQDNKKTVFFNSGVAFFKIRVIFSWQMKQEHLPLFKRPIT